MAEDGRFADSEPSDLPQRPGLHPNQYAPRVVDQTIYGHDLKCKWVRAGSNHVRRLGSYSQDQSPPLDDTRWRHRRSSRRQPRRHATTSRNRAPFKTPNGSRHRGRDCGCDRRSLTGCQVVKEPAHGVMRHRGEGRRPASNSSSPERLRFLQSAPLGSMSPSEPPRPIADPKPQRTRGMEPTVISSLLASELRSSLPPTDAATTESDVMADDGGSSFIQRCEGILGG
jgi:hypothetical protein